MSLSFNIDIHCHPSTKPFMSGVEVKQHTPFETFEHSIEAGLLSHLKGFISRITEVELSSQSNFDRLFEGEFKVVIASITPMERGFLVLNRKNFSLMGDVLAIQTTPPFEGTIRPQVINALMGFGIRDIEKVRGSESFKDYYRQGLREEYDYLVKTDGLVSPLHGYSVKFVKTFSEIREGIDNNHKTIYVLISIEGAHSLSSDPPSLLDIANDQDLTHKGEQDNFMRLKQFDDNLRDLKSLPFVPLFITPMHHFWNGLGGHARSLNKMVGELLSQTEGINLGLTALGKQVIRFILSREHGKRIFIDVKHMSAQSRVDFYELLKMEFNNEDIPIISSHAGIASNTATLHDFITKVNDHDVETMPRNYLHEASINMCKEDVLTISASGGLIGLQLDEKRISGDGFNKIKQVPGLTPQQLNEEYVKVLAANIFTAVQYVNEVKAWDIFAVGSDFDGLINHLDNCPSAALLTASIRLPLLKFLKDPGDIGHALVDFSMSKEVIKELMFDLTPDQIIDKIFAGNVMDFLKKHF